MSVTDISKGAEVMLFQRNNGVEGVALAMTDAWATEKNSPIVDCSLGSFTTWPFQSKTGPFVLTKSLEFLDKSQLGRWSDLAKNK